MSLFFNKSHSSSKRSASATTPFTKESDAALLASAVTDLNKIRISSSTALPSQDDNSNAIAIVPYSKEAVIAKPVFHLLEEDNKAIFLIADMVGFTKRSQDISSTGSSKELIDLLNKIYKGFINIVKKEPSVSVVKIEADCIVLSLANASNKPDEQARTMLNLGISLCLFLNEFNQDRKLDPIHFRFGLHIGPAAKISCATPSCRSEDWVGKGVLKAALMESSGKPNCVQISRELEELIKPFFSEKNPYYFVHPETIASPRDSLTSVRISASAPMILAPHPRGRSSATNFLISTPNNVQVQPSKSTASNTISNTNHSENNEEVFQFVSSHDKAIFLFADMQDFAKCVERGETPALLTTWNHIYTNFVKIIEQVPSIEIIKITPACIMLSSSGLSGSEAALAKTMLNVALKMSQFLMNVNTINKDSHGHLYAHDFIGFRFGLHIGQAARVICRLPHQKPKVDILGDAVNWASRMELSSLPNQLQLTEDFYELVKDSFKFSSCTHTVKTLGLIKTYFVTLAIPRKDEGEDDDFNGSYTPGLDSIINTRRKSLSAPITVPSPTGTPDGADRHLGSKGSPKG